MEYNEETCLIDMLYKQLEFQQDILARRKQLTPSDVNASVQSKVHEACYHSSCMIVEFHEFAEQYEIDAERAEYNGDYEEFELTRLELTDAWIFFINQLLFSNLLPTKSLKYYFSKADIIYSKMPDTTKYDIYSQIGRITVADGALIHKLRFKKWKEYSELDDNIFELTHLVDNTIIEFAVLFIMLKMRETDVFKYFSKKYEENVNRQQKNGIYEK